jgi:hypothetical protein
LIALLGACGGGGGGGGSSAPVASVTGNVAAPAAGPGDTANYFPSAIGNSWLYDDAFTPAALNLYTGFTTITATGAATVAGASVIAFAQSSTVTGINSVTNYYAQSGGGLTFYGTNNAQDPVTPHIIPYAELLYPVQVGTVSSLMASNLPFGNASNGDALTASFTDTVTIAAIETVTVNAGVFANAARVVETQSGTARDTVTGATLPFTSTQTAWLAPGAGVVKSQTSLTLNGSAGQSDVQQARGYTVGGVVHGLGAYTVLDPYLGVTNDALALGIARSPTRQLIAAQDSPFGGVSTIKLYLTDLNGVQVASSSISSASGAALFFDGSQFLVAYNSLVTSGQLLIQAVNASTGALNGAPVLALSNGQTYAMRGTMGSSNGLLAYPSPPATPGNNFCLCGLFVQPGGTPQGPGQVTLASISPQQPPNAMPTGLAVAFDGSNYLIAWSEPVPPTSLYAPIYARRVSHTGAPVDAAPLLVTATSTISASPALAFDGSNYLITWLDNRGATSASDPNRVILATRLSAASGNLTVLDSANGLNGMLVSPGTPQMRGIPAVAFNGQDYVITWIGAVAANPNAYTPAGNAIQAARVSTAGVLTSGSGFEITVAQNGSSGGHLNQSFMTPVITGGNQGLIAWLEAGSNGTNSAITSVMVNPLAPF